MDQAIPMAAVTAPALEMYTVYFSPSDYPGKFVVRKWSIVGCNPQPALAPLIVCNRLSAARSALPAGLTRVPRDPDDDLAILETWV